VRYRKSLGAACALVALLVLPIASSVAAEVAAQPRTVLKPAKDRGTTPRGNAETAANETASQSQRALSLCMADWDAATHMTKQEWRRACERSVKYDPDAFR
jgi:hypothetical protein